jgi:hypothetical protein
MTAPLSSSIGSAPGSAIRVLPPLIAVAPPPDWFKEIPTDQGGLLKLADSKWRKPDKPARNPPDTVLAIGAGAARTFSEV